MGYRWLGAIVSIAVVVGYGTAEQVPNMALRNGLWFNGQTFEQRTVYCVNGRFTDKKPARLDRDLDLAGTWVIPPFGEAHNHNIGSAAVEQDRKAIAKYLADGVFYVKVQGNLALTTEAKRGLRLNEPAGVDAVFAQGTITAPGGHPIELVELFFPRGSQDKLKDHLYFVVDSEAELEQKWPRIVALQPDFIKMFLWSSDEFDKRRNDPAYFGLRGLDPRLLPKIVAKAHACGLRVSAHVTNAADFHQAVVGGVDEISHLPFLGATRISEEDAVLAAKRGLVVDTTCSLARTLPKSLLPTDAVPALIESQKWNLRLLAQNGVRVAIGSDNVGDSSVYEFERVRELGAFDDLSLLRMWTQTTPQSIFPRRKIGELRDGFEASFLALEGNPLADLRNLRKIKLRCKQGLVLEGAPAKE